MNVGKLYEIQKYFWLLYPSKDIAGVRQGAVVATEAEGAAFADFLSNRFKCNVSSVSPKSIFCLLEQDGEYYKVLTTNGEVGWIILADWYKDDIEEVNQ
jgi:hypothetical protein